MTTLQRIRDDHAGMRAMLEARRFEAPLDRIAELDAKSRALRAKKETLQAERNKASRGGPPSDAVKARMREVGDEIRGIDAELGPLEAERDELVLHVPNIVDPAAPRGTAYEDNKVVREDEPRKLAFAAKPHWEIGERLGILDIPRGTKLSGSRFYVLRGAGAALQRALIAWMIDLKIDAGFTEIYPPFLTRRETLIASSHLPHFAENQYHDEQDDLWLIPTAEPQLVGLHGDEILDGQRFPLHYVSYTACFRREQLSAGRDVRGIKRGHQFDKVEMVVYCHPEDSPKELQGLVDRAVDVLERLELPVRVLELCTGELAFQATRGYDVETWSPGVGEWLEVSSCSSCGSFQAERAAIRYRRDPKGKIEHPHLLNGSGLALPRLMIAVIENYQQADGSLVIPSAVRPYMRGRERIAAGEFAL
ncbi:MAG TPA: serine--tRNA ligase [Candidatus Limnocylindria bacterium]|nr:serine--tRNA ligase [Candidatus Limnocylindria bacterium]